MESKLQEAAASAAAAAAFGKKFDLTKLERLETAAELAAYKLQKERLEANHASNLLKFSMAVLKRVGVNLEDGRFEIHHEEKDGAIVSISVVPEAEPPKA